MILTLFFLLMAGNLCLASTGQRAASIYIFFIAWVLMLAYLALFFNKSLPIAL